MTDITPASSLSPLVAPASTDKIIVTRDGVNLLTLLLSVLFDSPAFTNNPTAPTQDLGDASDKLATTNFVAQALEALGTDTIVDESGIDTASPPTLTGALLTLQSLISGSSNSIYEFTVSGDGPYTLPASSSGDYEALYLDGIRMPSANFTVVGDQLTLVGLTSANYERGVIDFSPS